MTVKELKEYLADKDDNDEILIFQERGIHTYPCYISCDEDDFLTRG